MKINAFKQIVFKAKSTGEAAVKFGENSRMLLDDGKGTGMELRFEDGNYLVE